MPSDIDIPAFSRFSDFASQQPSSNEAEPYVHHTKVLIWIGFVSASWAAAIVVGYALWLVL